MKCHCNNCIFYGSLELEKCATPKTLEQMIQEVKEENIGFHYYENPKCPGLAPRSCGEEIKHTQDMCDACQARQEYEEYLDELAVDAVIQRQLDEEEYQLDGGDDT